MFPRFQRGDEQPHPTALGYSFCSMLNRLWVTLYGQHGSKQQQRFCQRFPASAIHGCCLYTDTLYMLYLEYDSEYEDTATTVVIKPRRSATLLECCTLEHLGGSYCNLLSYLKT